MGWAGCFSARLHNSPSSTGSCEPGSQVSLTSGAPLRQLSSSLVPHSKNCDGAAQVVRLISPLLCGGTTGQLCPWCPPTVPPTPPSLAWAAAVPHGESLSLRELHWSLLQPPWQQMHVLKALKYEQKGGVSVTYKLWRVTQKRERYINFYQ